MHRKSNPSKARTRKTMNARTKSVPVCFKITDVHPWSKKNTRLAKRERSRDHLGPSRPFDKLWFEQSIQVEGPSCSGFIACSLATPEELAKEPLRR